MFERRRQAASPASLLVVTLLFVGACSSGDHEAATVTTSGGSGSETAASGGSKTMESEGGAPSDVPLNNGAASSIGEGGAPPTDSVGSAGGTETESNGGAETQPRGGSGNEADAGAAPAEMGGTGPTDSGGTAGSVAAAGKPAVVEPTCAPGGSTSTEGLSIPCDVYAAMYVCRTCHSNPPTKPANRSFTTYAEVKPNAAIIYGVVKTEWMPPPPAKMSTAQRNTLLKWLGTNGSCAVGAAQGCK